MENMFIEEKIIQIVRENVAIDKETNNQEISVNTSLNESFLSSIEFIKILIEIEIAFGFEFDDENLVQAKFPQIKDLIKYAKMRCEEMV